MATNFESEKGNKEGLYRLRYESPALRKDSRAHALSDGDSLIESVPDVHLFVNRNRQQSRWIEGWSISDELTVSYSLENTLFVNYPRLLYYIVYCSVTMLMQYTIL